MRIFKYPLEHRAINTVVMPAGAIILTAQRQGNDITLWAEVDTDAPPELRTFHIIGTGDSTPSTPVTYVGTVQYSAFVWHIYEEVTR